MDTKLLLTVDEAADRLGCKRSKAYQLIQSGELGSVKLGKCRRVPVSEVERFVNRLITEQIVLS